MFRNKWRLSILVLAATSIALLALAGTVTASRSPAAPRLARPAQGGEVKLPCNPSVSRTVSKQVVKAGEAFYVQVEYNYKCSNAKRRINFVIMVENTPYLRGGDPTPKPAPEGVAAPAVGEMLNNVKNGLKRFVNDVDFANGSMGSFMRYADNYGPILPLQGGEQQRDNLNRWINQLNGASDGGASGLAGALRDAVGSLPEGTTDATNAVIIVDAGALLYSDGPKLSQLQTSCDYAKTQGVYRVVVGLPAAGNRLQGWCSDYMFVVRDRNGTDLSAPGGIFDQISDLLITGSSKVDSVEYFDRHTSEFEYVLGTGRVDGKLVEPAMISGNELSWTSTTAPDPGGRLIEYQLKAREDAWEGTQNLSMESGLSLAYPGMAPGKLVARNFEMCIYTATKPNYCDGHSAKLTATAAAPTAGTPSTPTPVPPTATATEPPTVTDTPTATDTPSATDTATPKPPTLVPTATDTPIGKVGKIFLPVLLRAHEFIAQ